jgi:hypothetical protein
MRLYTNNQGSWVGTQADAKREFGKDWSEVDVPTDKSNLLSFLNNKSVGGVPSNIPDLIKKNELEGEKPETHGQSCSGNREVREAAALNRYDVKDVVLNCPKEYLGGALSSIVTRIYDMEDELNA